MPTYITIMYLGVHCGKGWFSFDFSIATMSTTNTSRSPQRIYPQWNQFSVHGHP